MLKLKKGGIETIIATVVLVGIVIALIISAILPYANQSQQLTNTATNSLGDLQNTIEPDSYDPQ